MTVALVNNESYTTIKGLGSAIRKIMTLLSLRANLQEGRSEKRIIAT
jgi:hypothetical protein